MQMRSGPAVAWVGLTAVLAAVLMVACGGSESGGDAASASGGGSTAGAAVENSAAANASVTTLIVVSGDGQKGLTQTPLRQVVLKATDSSGAGVGGATISFEIVSGSGTLSSTTATTDDAGQATVVPSLGSSVGALHLRATVQSTQVTARFKMTAVDSDPATAQAPATYNPDWTVATHSIASPNAEVVFPQSKVNRIDIQLSPAQWAGIRADMVQIYGGDFGAGSGNGGMGGGNPGGVAGPGGGASAPGDGAGAPGGGVSGPGDGASAPTGGAMGGNGGAGAITIGSGQETSYVGVTLSHDGKVWRQVGFRLKGNSTLSSLWGSGNFKLPFRLKFDAFEDLYYPALYRQRFHGFKELTFSPGARDTTQLHEKLASDLLRKAGVPAARTAFYAVYVDAGTGPVYNGLYTAVEVVDDTLVPDLYAGDTTGNIYKPESSLQTFRQAEFDKKNNAFAADYSDVIGFIDALNAGTRTSDRTAWRRELEARFDVDGFLRWLAMNNAIVNWDTYGRMAHNYYLYRASDGRLVWIPWDHNEALTGSPGLIGSTGTGAAGLGGGTSNGLSLTMSEVSASWPLLRHLADDELYFGRYKALLKEVAAEALDQADFDARVDRYFALIAPHVLAELPQRTSTTAAQFNAGPATLKAHLAARRALISSFAP